MLLSVNPPCKTEIFLLWLILLASLEGEVPSPNVALWFLAMDKHFIYEVLGKECPELVSYLAQSQSTERAKEKAAERGILAPSYKP